MAVTRLDVEELAEVVLVFDVVPVVVADVVGFVLVPVWEDVADEEVLLVDAVPIYHHQSAAKFWISNADPRLTLYISSLLPAPQNSNEFPGQVKLQSPAAAKTEPAARELPQ